MKNKRILAGLALITFAVTSASQTARAGNVEADNAARAIRVAPPAPRFTDAERHTELRKRRQNVADKIGKNSTLVLFSAEPKIYTNDVYYVFRQENNLYYLTALKQKNATLILLPGSTPSEVLFLPKRDPSNEVWNGRMYGREDAERLSGIKTILDASELTAFIDAMKKRQAYVSPSGVTVNAATENLYLLLPGGERDRNGMREFRQEFEFSNSLTAAGTTYKIQNAQPIFGELRHIKSPYELKILQHAIDITTEAFGRSMAVAGRSKNEFEVQAEVEFTFRRRNADYWGYPSIVGCGPNATTLHYEDPQGAVKSGDLLLMDVGAEYDHYTADVTRTFPVNGKFTKEQAEIYQIVYDAQEAAARETKPGANFGKISEAAASVIKNGLTRLGLITAPEATFKLKLANGQFYDAPQYRLWYMHGLGHWLGMNVHDVGEYGAPLKPGMVYTNEPGIYVREDALDYALQLPENKEILDKIRPAFERYKNIGVRIEDDMLVTNTGVEWMTKNLPRKIADIEAMVARASKELPVSTIENERLPKSRILFDANANSLFPETQLDLFNQKLFGGENFATGETVRSGFAFVGTAKSYVFNDPHKHSHSGE